jgi:dolichol-phosphate mannosyltransferase
MPETANDYSDLTVIIPVKNEEEGISHVINELLDAGVNKENIIVIDGHSTDKTVEIVKSLGVKVVEQKGTGKADAVRLGIKLARTPLIMLIDGDYTYPAHYLKDLYTKIKTECLDEVIGARNFNKKSQKLIYRLGNKILTGVFNILFGTKLSDVLSGMYILKKKALRDLAFTSTGFGIESEIAAHIASTSGRIGEVPIEYRERKGKKKLNVKHGLSIVWQMIKLTWQYNPAFLVFITGAVTLLLPGLILAGHVCYELIFEGVKRRFRGIIAVTPVHIFSLGLDKVV